MAMIIYLPYKMQIFQTPTPYFNKVKLFKDPIIKYAFGALVCD